MATTTASTGFPETIAKTADIKRQEAVFFRASVANNFSDRRGSAGNVKEYSKPAA